MRRPSLTLTAINCINMKTRSIYFLITLFITLFLPMLSIAQGGGLPAAPADVPIDGGLSLLLAAGVGYGVKKIRDERKKKNQQ